MKLIINICFKKSLNLLFFFVGCFNLISQTITVNDTDFSSQQLVNLLLANSCATTSNISTSSNQSVAYFNGNGSIFPIQEGIIIRSGIAANSQGIYTGNGLNSQVNNNTDADLQAISNQSGQSAIITDTAFLEFNFVPSSTSFSFDFLFASNEYGEWQCGYSDVFAFLLTDLDTGETTNLAIIPGTNTPISVRDIRDEQFNSSCNSVNPDLFSVYNVDNPANSALNMKGHTVILNASSDVIPNNPYRIKLVVGDYNDSDFDSAVFIEAGSFDTNLDIGPDLEICDGDNITLDAGYTNTVDFSYQWRRDGIEIIGENDPSLTIAEAGTYELIITTLSTGCQLNDQVLITDLAITEPNNLIECDSGGATTFNLTINDHSTLGINPAEYTIFYYTSLDNANNNISITDSELASYPGLDGDIIYMRIQNNNSTNFCNSILEFTLNIASIQATTPDDFEVCESDTTTDIVSQVESQILNGLNPTLFTVNYYPTEYDAINNSNVISNPTVFPLPGNLNPISIWARLNDNNITVCFDIINFSILINPSPLVDDLPDVYSCRDFTLPTLINGNYFTESGGSGTALFAGDLITEETTIFIYNEDLNGCFNQTSFRIFMADEYELETEYCGEFILPSYTNAEFYTAPNGPNGTGTLIPTGTTFTDDVTIYFFVEIEDVFCIEMQFDILVHPLPIAEERDDVITCDSYALPPVLNGEQYFSGAGGSGTEYFPGDQITSTQTLFLWNINPITSCTNQSSYQINIIDTSVFQDLDACEEYPLPNVTFGGYFTETNGGGSSIAVGTILTTSQTIYYYAPEVTTTTNCTDNIAINITINPIPLVDELDDILRCENDLPVLQPLTNGQYFTASGGNGTQLFAGDIINLSQTIYIYNSNAFCEAETSFNIEIRTFPLVDNFTDIYSCDPFVLPALSYGQYFTETGGQGTQLSAGDIISETQTLYIFNQYDDLAGCINENIFTINIIGVTVDDPEDVIECGQYELPTLTVGDYFTEPSGQGLQLNAGDLITSTQTIYIYGENGSRYTCNDENSFTVSIYEIPNLDILEHIESCESVTLPTLNLPGIEIEYYRRPNRVDLINPADYTITEIGSRIIFVYAFSTENPDCFTETNFQITVYDLLDLEIEGGTICINSETGDTVNPLLLQSGLDPNEFTVSWFLDDDLVGTGPNFNALEAGTYTVETTKLSQDIGPNCNYKTTEVVVEGSAPIFEINFLSNDFSDSYTIDVNVIDPGLGFYEFSLDNGPFQSFLRFYDVSPGNHIVTIRDISGLCGNFSISFTALDYPRFFTPNDDGVKDTWNIPALRNDPNATIKIYNRLGKLIANIKPSGQGWNGFNNNGNKEPSSDYWFLVEYTKDGVSASFRGNFSLLRR